MENFRGASNREFNELARGPGRAPPTVTRAATRQQLTTAWRIEEVEMNEPSSRFTRSFEARFLTDQAWLVNPAPSVNASEREIERFYSEGDTFLTGFTNALLRRLRGEDVARIRVYVVYEDTIDIVGNAEEPGSGRHNRNTYTLTALDLRALRRNLNLSIAIMMDKYQAIDANFERNAGAFTIRIDVEPVSGGGHLPASFPINLDANIIFEPKGQGSCAFKCLAAAMKKQDEWRILQAQMGLEDFCHYGDLITKFVELKPEYSVRLMSVSGLLKHRVDGAQFRYEPYMSGGQQITRQHKCIYLILEERHYFWIKQICLFIKHIRKNIQDARFCHGCCRIFEGMQAWVNHECCDTNICDKCNFIFTEPFQKHAHKQTLMEVDFSCACGFCGQANFYSESCRAQHIIFCPAAKASRRHNVQVRAEARRRPRCDLCRASYDSVSEHCCYMEKKELPKDESEFFNEWYAFDYESMLIYDSELECYKHVVNKVCVQKLYDRPFKRWTFDTLLEFIEWLDNYCCSITDQKFAFIAHNMKGYDGRLTLAKLFDIQYEKDSCDSLIEKMIWVGSKISTFRWKNVTFRDSLLHIQQPLSTFPKVFGLTEMHKGFFPYLFNIPENQDYIGPIPHIKYFEPDMKSFKGRKELLQWYSEQQDVVYNFKEELEKYCISDVDILAQSMEKYNEAGKKLNHKLLPPLERLTIAAYTLNCWKTLHMPEGKIVNHTTLEAKRAREALRGGRTDVRCFYKKYSMEDVFVHSKYAKYVDVQSMYPFVMHTKEMPVGKPQTFNGEEASIEWINDNPTKIGFACIDANPPEQYVHHPAAVHNDDRTNRLVAQLSPWKSKVFCLTEIRDMVEEGWVIEHVYWIQAYDGDCDLFKEYISKLVAEKIHSSSSPPDNFEEIQREWKERFNVELDRALMCLNPGLRQIAKLQLNSLWGKLSERAKLEFYHNVDPEQFLELELQEMLGEIKFKQKFRISSNTWFVAGERLQRRLWEKTLIENRKNTNVAIGAHVTMWGRRMLWEEMKKLGKRVLYHDTDSILYEYDPSKEYNTKTGKYLGDWEEELPGCAIIEFVGLAPKTYGYKWIDFSKGIPIPEDDTLEWYQSQGEYKIWENKLYKVSECVKVKGININYESQKSINFDSLVELFKETRTSLQAEQIQFIYKRDKGSMVSKHMIKALIFNYEKGVRGLVDEYSYPFGVENYWRQGLVNEGDMIRIRDAARL